MDCKKVQEIIFTDYIDAKISDAALLKDIETHLSSCSQCKSLAAELGHISAEFRNMEKIKVPDEVWHGVRSKIAATHERGFFPGNIFGSLQNVALGLRPAFVAATAAIVILAVLLVSRMVSYNNTVSPELTSNDLMSIVSLEENGNGPDYDFGTPEESYFL